MKNANQLTFQEDGSPFSTTFNDIYFDTESGCTQSEQVFLKGNDIESRLAQQNHCFTIAETGFGTGLNFLLTLACFAKLLHKSLEEPEKSIVEKLHFISVEKYPLQKHEIEQSLSTWPELAPYWRAMLLQYPDMPEALAGQAHNMHFFDERVKLTIIFDDATHGYKGLRTGKQGLVDAWYLDGFSPATNPEMWNDALFSQIGRLSKLDGTIATFTVAGFVRRGLEQVGFRLEKKATDGKKKETLVGIYQQNPKQAHLSRAKATKPQHVTIIGGGIASACAALALAKEKIKVTVLCKDEEIADGASSNDVGAVYPLIHQVKDDISLFYEQALYRARELYDELSMNGYHFTHQWSGLLELSFKDALRKRQALFEQNSPWPKSLIKSVNKTEATQLANIALNDGGLFIEKAGWVAPKELVNALFQAAQNLCNVKIKTRVSAESISQCDNGKWLIKTNKGNVKASCLVVTAGADTRLFENFKALPLSAVRGQISSMRANNKLANLKTVICHKGYLTPAYNDIQCIGATFDKSSIVQIATEKDDEYNLAVLEKCMPDHSDWQKGDIVSSKARLRCMTPDHMPLVGPMPKISEHLELYAHLRKDKHWKYEQPAPYEENLYVMTGFGARGLCSAPLLADILAADLTGKPYPVDHKTLVNTSVNRFVIKDLIKNKV